MFFLRAAEGESESNRKTRKGQGCRHVRAAAATFLQVKLYIKCLRCLSCEKHQTLLIFVTFRLKTISMPKGKILIIKYIYFYLKSIVSKVRLEFSKMMCFL